MLFGYPGCGKGTIVHNVKKMAEKTSDVEVISVGLGDYFRQKALNDINIRDVVDSGELIANSLANEAFEFLLYKAVTDYVIATPPSQQASKVIIALDGYPRNVQQWHNFVTFVKAKRHFKVAAAFVDVPLEEIIRRAGVRRICECGRTFVANPNGCPDCGKVGYPRTDDVNIEKRIAVFDRETRQVVHIAQQLVEHQISVDGCDTKTAAEQIWQFLQ
ncbi:MAG: nucleoside monophosphate kinase [Alphaproteobacteria bacterium]|nr:nucleoside monophosphate kinase [Alphaproteobacteria bacterium]